MQLQVDKLQTLGVNKIIALGHSGFTKDQEIAKKVKGLDVVIGGHTNTFLYTGTTPFAFQCMIYEALSLICSHLTGCNDSQDDTTLLFVHELILPQPTSSLT